MRSQEKLLRKERISLFDGKGNYIEQRNIEFCSTQQLPDVIVCRDSIFVQKQGKFQKALAIGVPEDFP